jgi:hypothetical protein
MFSYQTSIEEFGETLTSLIKITECKEEIGILYLQECQKKEKHELYRHYDLVKCLTCISKNISRWKNINLSEQELELNKL